jgi:glycosyltransferase involved in cell wall biosynthesis
MKRNLIFITGKLVKGGSERVISILANHFAKTCNVKIITLLSGEVEYEMDDSIEIITLYKSDRFRAIRLIKWLLYLIREFRRSRGNNAIVISFVARINIVSLVANLFADLPIIVSERNDPERDGRGITARLLIKILYPGADYIVFQSSYARGLFNKRIQNRGRVIYNPINMSQLRKPSVKQKAFVNVGRLAKQKNQAILLKAFSEVVIRYPEYSLLIYGEGPQENILKKMIYDMGLSESVKLMGTTDNIHEKIIECMCFVLSSDYEGQSNALLEAMAMGMPCITTDIPGQREIVNDKNALIVEPGNLLQLSKAMLDIIDDEELRHRIGEEASMKLAELDIDKILGKWEEIVGDFYEK